MRTTCTTATVSYTHLTTFDTTGRLTGAIFSEQLKRKNTIYTRLERHEYAAGVQTIQNKAFRCV